MPDPAPREARILITVSGPDHPGITAELTSILARAGSEILDMEQVVVQGRLSLSILVAGESSGATAVVKDLLFAAKEHGSDLDFRMLEPDDSVSPARSSYVLTLLGEPVLGANAVAAISRVLAAHAINIEKIQKLSERRFATLEMTIGMPGEGEARAVRTDLVRAAAGLGVDFALQPEGLFRRAKRLVVFDLDSTLVRGEMIVALGSLCGRADAIADITRRSMNGEMDYAASLRERVALLAGLPEAALQEAASEAELMPGAAELVGVLRRLGFRTAIVSGGFAPVAEALRRRLGIDWAHANEVEVADGRLTGRVQEPILDGEAKARIVRELASRHDIALDQVIAVGDGANDIPMLEAAGLGIAFNAHAAVREKARHMLNRPRLDSILFLLGITEKEIRALQQREA